MLRNLKQCLAKLKSRNFLLILPFSLISLLLVIIPLIIIVIYALTPVSIGNETLAISSNFEIFNLTVGQILGKSIWVSLLATFLCLCIAYPFAYFLSFAKNPVFKVMIMVIVTAPIWSSFLIKLIGLKTLLDIMNGGPNSTFGVFYTLIGLVYLYLPFAIIPIYNVLSQMPRNLINASQDLGMNGFQTFFRVIIPYTKIALMSAIILVFLPSFTTVAVSQFLDNSNDGSLIGDINYQQGLEGLDSNLSLARSSALSLVISIIMFLIYGVFVFTPKIFNIIVSENPKYTLIVEFNKIGRWIVKYLPDSKLKKMKATNKLKDLKEL